MKLINNPYISLLIIGALIISCSGPKNEDESFSGSKNKEAWEDSLKLASALEMQSKIRHRISAVIETEPVQESPNEDAADDPAIWYNQNNPDSSLIFGTNKKSGVHAYDLNGKEIEFYPFGKINNIDIRQNVLIGKDTLDILSGSNRTDNSIILYKINKGGKLVPLLSQNHPIDLTIIDEVYGFSLYKNENKIPFAIVNGKNGVIHQYQIINHPEKDSAFLQLANTWQLNSQPEGMVADDELASLYIGEEENGIWKIDLKNPQLPPAIIESSQQKNNPLISYDIEGLAIYYGKNESGFLLASIQGNFSYAFFDRHTNAYLGSFSIVAGEQIDGVEETDGLEIYSEAIGESFPHGLFVVQDGFNYDAGEKVGQNFKYISLEDVTGLLEEKMAELNEK